MTLLFADSCGNYTATADILDRYIRKASHTIDLTGGRHGGPCHVITVRDGYIKLTLPQRRIESTTFVSFWYYAGNMNAGERTLAAWQSGSGWEGGGPNDGWAYVLKHDQTGVVSSSYSESAPNVLKGKRWHWIEMSYEPHQSAGNFTLRVNGVEAFTDTSVDTILDFGSTDASFFLIGGVSTMSNAADRTRISDIIMHDDQGSSFTTYMGPLRVEMLRPDADGVNFATDWTLSAGSDHYAMVDESPPPEDRKSTRS